MGLLSLWHTHEAEFAKKTIDQIVAMAGDGKLRDDGDCSSELRQYLAEVKSESLAQYADQCLAKPSTGLALQDVVNELGRRLDYEVENGRYQGTVQTTGFDGIWRDPGNAAEQRDLVVEVKSSTNFP